MNPSSTRASSGASSPKLLKRRAGAPMIVRMSAHSAPTHTPSLTNTANQYVPSLRPIIFMLSISFASFSATTATSVVCMTETNANPIR